MQSLVHTFNNWGLLDADYLNIAKEFGGERLWGVYIHGQSQIDRVFIHDGAGRTNPQLCGLRTPYYADGHSENKRALLVKPAQYFFNNNADLYPSNNYDSGRGFNEWSSFDVYGGAGGHLALEAFYGGLPPSYAMRRDVMRLQTHLNVINGNKTARWITVGRDFWEMTLLDTAGVGGFTWTIYGCTERWQTPTSTRIRTALATGAGAFNQQGSRGYDAIEIDYTDAAGPYNTDIAFTARDM